MRTTKNIKYFTFVSLVSLLMLNCVEEITVKTEEFDDFLTVEAIITDENKHHEIKLSRTFSFEEEQPTTESNAEVLIRQGNNVYQFREIGDGLYRSENSFAAIPDLEYQLSITTANGENYLSDEIQLTEKTPMDRVYFERGFNEMGAEGISVFIDAFDPKNNSKFYRFEYEETYKIIAPLYSPLELVVLNRNFPIPPRILLTNIADYLVSLRPRTEQKQVCFNTVKSNRIIQTNTVDLTEDRLDKYRLRFLNRSNYIVSHRYSILVRQFIQSREAYTYYKTLNEFANSESILSENQPGFIEGNIRNINDASKKVLGVFEVSSVDIKRIFFNYADLFPDEPLPPYAITCIAPNSITSPSLWNTDPGHPNLASSSPLVDALDQGFQYFDINLNDNEAPWPYRPFLLVPRACGDCTALGINKEPDFWVE